VLAGAFEGVYEARGRSGQAIVIWPDKEVVAVFTGRGLDVRGEVGGLNHLRIRGDFGADVESVELEFTDPGEYFPLQRVQGTAAPSCN